MTEEQFCELMKKLEEIRCCIIDVELMVETAIRLRDEPAVLVPRYRKEANG